MYSFIDINILQVDSQCKKDLLFLYDKYMNHEFDLLGSGFHKIYYGMDVKGFQGMKYTYHRSFKYEKRRLKQKKEVSKEYEPINWFIDYKSGFYFEPLIYNSRVKCLQVIEKKPGVDIKCPWELGRFYHLVQLAIVAVADSQKRQKIIKEYMDEIYDFIYSNPIGKTVQWSCPMDCGIRIVNTLISFDILKQIDFENRLDKKFDQTISNFIYESAIYILENLEYYGKKNASGNHYLSDLIGILFAASYLKQTEETDAWLVFATQELIDQFDKQFYNDGTNIEGSTSYHRLSTEIMVYATSLVYGVLNSERKNVFENYDRSKIERLLPFNRQKYNIGDEKFFPQWYLNRLYLAGQFTKVILKDNDEIVQIGDNDSGRIVKLTPTMINQLYEGEENELNHRTLLSSMAGLFTKSNFNQIKLFTLEYSIIKTLSQEKNVKVPEYTNRKYEKNNINKIELDYVKETVLYKDDNRNLVGDDTEIYYYENWGLVILRTKRVYLSFMIGSSKTKQQMVHMHNDSLSIELLVDGNYITRDPGTYIYTAFLKERDRFRSTKAHNTIHVRELEQNDFNGTFGMRKISKCELICCTKNLIIAKNEYRGIEHIRKVVIKENLISVIDYCNCPFTVGFNNKVISNGYGKIRLVK